MISSGGLEVTATPLPASPSVAYRMCTCTRMLVEAVASAVWSVRVVGGAVLTETSVRTAASAKQLPAALRARRCSTLGTPVDVLPRRAVHGLGLGHVHVPRGGRTGGRMAGIQRLGRALGRGRAYR